MVWEKDQPREIARYEREGTEKPRRRGGLRRRAQVRFEQRLQFVRKLFWFFVEGSADVKCFSFDQEVLVVENSVGEV